AGISSRETKSKTENTGKFHSRKVWLQSQGTAATAGEFAGVKNEASKIAIGSSIGSSTEYGIKGRCIERVVDTGIKAAASHFANVACGLCARQTGRISSSSYCGRGGVGRRA